MNKPCLTVSIPSTVFPYICNSVKELQAEMLLFLAVKCYQRSLLSIGKAAELAEMSRVNFEIYLSENKIPVSNLDYSDVSGDLEKLKI
jgi:predicted HTH domain antitoxin